MTTPVGEAFVAIRPTVNRAQFSSDLNRALSGQEVSNIGTKAGRTVGKGIEDETDKASQRAGSKMETRFNQATSRVGSSFGKLGGLLESQFGLPFAGVLDTIGSKIEGVESKGKGLGGIFANIGKGVTVAGVAGFGLIAGEAVHLADTYELVHARLETVIKNTGSNIEQLNPIIDEQISHFAKLGFNQTEYEKALTRLTLATKDPQKALAYMGEAADIAAVSGKDLTSSAVLLGKVLQGSTGPLKRFGVDIGTATGGAKALATAQDAVTKATQDIQAVQAKVADGRLKGKAAQDAEVKAYVALKKAQDDVTKAQDAGTLSAQALADRIKGAAAKQAETFAGKLKGMQTELTNVGIKIGLFLIPWIEKLVGAIQDVIGWFEKHKGIAEALAIALGTTLVVAMAAFAASAVVAAATTIAAMAPVLLPIAAIGLAIADAILAWQRFGPAIEDAINATIIPAVNLFVDAMNSVVDAANVIPGVNLQHIGHVGDLGGGGGQEINSSGGVGSAPYGPPTAPLGFGKNGAPIQGPVQVNPYQGVQQILNYLGSLPKQAGGGWVAGTGNRDSQLTWLTPGEYVMSKPEVAAARSGAGRDLHIHFPTTPASPTRYAVEIQHRLTLAAKMAAL